MRMTGLAAAVKVQQATASLAKVTPIKGGSLEGQVHVLMNGIAAGLGDEYQDTTNQVGLLPRCKKGDGVLTVGGHDVRLVVEVTDSKRAGWTAYFDEAERNRAGVASLGVVRSLEQNAGQAIRVVGSRRLVVALDPETDDDDRFMAASTLADVLYPNTHEGDRMLGMDLKEAERIAQDNPEARAALADMDREEASFADALAAAMTARGVSQSELAKRVGIGQPAISMMLARECRPQKRTVRRLAEGLGMNPTELWANYNGGN